MSSVEDLKRLLAERAAQGDARAAEFLDCEIRVLRVGLENIEIFDAETTRVLCDVRNQVPGFVMHLIWHMSYKWVDDPKFYDRFVEQRIAPRVDRFVDQIMCVMTPGTILRKWDMEDAVASWDSADSEIVKQLRTYPWRFEGAPVDAAGMLTRMYRNAHGLGLRVLHDFLTSNPAVTRRMQAWKEAHVKAAESKSERPIEEKVQQHLITHEGTSFLLGMVSPESSIFTAFRKSPLAEPRLVHGILEWSDFAPTSNMKRSRDNRVVDTPSERVPHQDDMEFWHSKRPRVGCEACADHEDE